MVGDRMPEATRPAVRPMPGNFRGFAFDRRLLPEPVDYYAGEGVRLFGRGAWRNALCPFHQDTSPSLRLRIETGAFRCMACGARGGDVLPFHMQRHELRFVEAVRSLGAWAP